MNPPDPISAPGESRIPLRISLRLAALAIALGALYCGLNGLPAADAFGRLWARWDPAYYLEIAAGGYPIGPRAHAIAFLPLYPLLIRGVSALGLAPETAGMLVANAGFVAALVFLFRLAALELGRPAGYRAMLWLASFPTAYFLHSIYSESVFVALAVAAFYFARTRAWTRAWALCALATATRLTGLALVAGLAVEFLLQNREQLRSARVWAHAPRASSPAPSVSSLTWPSTSACTGTRWRSCVSSRCSGIARSPRPPPPSGSRFGSSPRTPRARSGSPATS